MVSCVIIIISNTFCNHKALLAREAIYIVQFQLLFVTFGNKPEFPTTNEKEVAKSKTGVQSGTSCILIFRSEVLILIPFTKNCPKFHL